MSRTTIAIDNGVTGSIAIIGPDGVFFEPVPTSSMLMGKAGKYITRINCRELEDMIRARVSIVPSVYIERPFTGGPMFINTMLIAARAHESVMICLERLLFGHQTVDSKEWQKAVLGDIKGSAALKKASAVRGATMFPAHAKAIRDHGDADSLLMAQYYHNQSTQ